MKFRSFQAKLLCAMLALVMVMTALTVGLMTVFIRNEILRKTETDLHKAQSTFHAQQRQRFEKLEDICGRLVSSRRLAAAIEEGDPKLVLGVAQNEQEISKLQHSFLAIADRKGHVLVRARGGDFVSPAADAELPEQSLLDRAQALTDKPLRGYFVSGISIFEAICMPLRTGEETLGHIIVAFEVTNGTATELAVALGRRHEDDAARLDEPPPGRGIKRIAQDVEVVFAVDNQIVASTLQPGPRKIVESMLGGRGQSEKIEFDLEGTPYVAFVSPLMRAGRSAHQVILLSQQALVELLGTLRQGALLSGAVAIALSLLISAWLSRDISTPVSELESATRLVRQGNFDARVTPRTADEVGRLAEAFNEMTAGLGLKEKYRGVLDKVVSPEVAEELLRGNIELGGEMRTVTVLFSDIRGFTPLSEKLKPREVLALLNEHMTAMTEVIRKHGGIVDKFVGDQVMAIFGAPKSGGNDALAAVRAAVEMRTRRSEINETELPFRRFEIGIGLNTGEVIAGNMGSDKQLSYTVLGQSVNLAARLCSAAKPAQVLVAQSVIQAAGNEVVATDLGAVQAKGISQPIRVFDVTAVR